MKKTAFTLAELLTAVLVISVIMVALAPVITKRMKDNISVTTDNKKGLEIFTNPGTYTFDVPIGINTLFIQGAGGGGGGAGASESGTKNTAFTSNSGWTVPNGVNKITLTITGSGGGGGAGNGNSTGQTCRSDEFRATRGSKDESDLCWMKNNRDTRSTSGQYGGFWNAGVTIEAPYTQTCTGGNCAWVWLDTMQYTYQGAGNVCKSYLNYVGHNSQGEYRLPKYEELNKLVQFSDDWLRSGNIGLCTWNSCQDHATGCSKETINSKVKQCSPLSKCLGVSNDWCNPFSIHGENAYLRWDAKGTGLFTREFSMSQAAAVRCVKSINNYIGYSGAGGASGAVLEIAINVLPNDKLEITIGEGGNAGAYNANRSNGLTERLGNGNQGGRTTVVHKRGSKKIGEYIVFGGFGGYGAKSNANGEKIPNGTASGQTSQWLCQIDPDGKSGASVVPCTAISYSGESGSSTKGGNGGRVKNEGSINNGEASSGGYLYVDSSRTANQRATNEEIRLAKGQNASTAGFGGGGGLTPAWANSTSHFYQGGKGANGKVEITYKVALPGGGGGSSARVGGVNSEGKMYEIQYKVKEGDRIVFKVGSGGTGGVASQDGTNGSATVVGDNDIVFLAGEGGKTATNDDKNNLKGGRGGSTSCINENNDIQTTTLGVKIKNTTTTKYSYMPSNSSFKGQNGKRGGVPSGSDIQGGYSLNNTIFNYGFTGGMGASPFGINTSKMSSSISCGGGNISGISSISLTLGQTTNINYLCASGNPKGNSALSHDPVNNEFGGSGGGGGGVVDDSFEQGTGGNGSSGYLRIRWDASEQE